MVRQRGRNEQRKNRKTKEKKIKKIKKNRHSFLTTGSNVVFRRDLDHNRLAVKAVQLSGCTAKERLKPVSFVEAQKKEIMQRISRAK